LSRNAAAFVALAENVCTRPPRPIDIRLLSDMLS
jgi:hypothetical protein